MSLKKVGNRSPRSVDGIDSATPPVEGIPGTGKSALFYQDSSRLPTVSHGDGIFIYDEEGKQYLDGCSGAVSANLGHRHPRMLRAATEQLDRIAFTYRTQFENRPANELADLLTRLSPPELSRVFFVNSGSEAVEAAMKLARQFWWASGQNGKTEIISRRPSYHGATLGALSATGYAPLNIPFRPMMIHFPKVAAAFCYHCPLKLEYPSCGIACAEELDEQIRLIGAENIAAFVTEPIGGSATGAAVPPDRYFAYVEQICHEHQILLIIDDVMTGCGRTGTFYGYEHWDITPDIVCCSKGLSAGYAPIGAIIASDSVVEPVLERGGFMHGHTYSGNPLSCAITLEAVRTILDDGLVENAREVGTYLHTQLHGLKDRYAVVGDVRGRGLMAGLEFVRSRAQRTPFPASWFVALEATEIARERGLLIYPRRSLSGLNGDHVLVAPPLIIDRAGVDELIDRLDATLSDLTGMLAVHLRDEVYDDTTVQRFQQSEEVPEYARGIIEQDEPVVAADANVTGAMSHDILDLEGTIERVPGEPGEGVQGGEGGEGGESGESGDGGDGGQGRAGGQGGNGSHGGNGGETPGRGKEGR
ncbi:MAG: aminotransferase class III-fold pyridoxal phosphate-dependent enzyme [Candidatus Krumholzibacteriia bacterium]